MYLLISFFVLNTDLKNWLDFISSITSSLAWPIAIITIIFVFKPSIISLFPKLKKLIFKDFSLEFDQSVKKVQEDLDEIVSENDSLITFNNFADDNSLDFYEKVTSNPRSTILDSWLPVEKKLIDLNGTLNPDLNPSKLIQPPYRILNNLKEQKIITPRVYNLFNDTRKLRNKVVHNIDVNITIENAIEYKKLCLELVSIIDNIEKGLSKD